MSCLASETTFKSKFISRLNRLRWTQAVTRNYEIIKKFIVTSSWMWNENDVTYPEPDTAIKIIISWKTQVS